jgi:carboxyl-terminal processing protease
MLQFMKNKILIPLLVIGALAAFFSFKYVRAGVKSSQQRRALVIETVMKTIQAGHYSARPIDDTFSVRVYRSMVTAFDGEKLYFTTKDIEKISKFEYLIDDQVKVGSAEFFDTLEAIYLRRMNASEKIFEEILKTPFSFNTDEWLQLTPEKNVYASDEKEQVERWRKYLKYRTLVKFVDLKTEQEKKKENKDSVNVKMKTDEELEVQARQEILKSNQRYIKRLRKGKDEDRFTFYVNKLTETEDPHTSYFPPVDKSAFDEKMSGSFVGIGARLNQSDDKTTVASVITGSPSWKQGELKEGDEIMKVAQGDKVPVDISGYELDDVVKLIRGEKGTEVRLTVRSADGAVKVIPIKRGVVEIEETFAKSAVIKTKDGSIGFIYLPEFYADFNHTSGRTCSKDVAIEVQKLKDAGVQGIILDLRYNGGGSLGDVVDMAGIFLGRGPVVQVKSSHSSPSILRSHPYDTALYSGPLAVMVNQGSASASEILAAVLQDHKRAIIVGSTTFGKGTVQKMVSLDDMIDPMTRLNLMSDTSGNSGGSIGALKLTMEKFYRVNGGSTQQKGVTPEIDMPDPYDGYDDEELGERHNKSALAWDEIPPVDYKTTNSIPNLPQVIALSQGRINANPTFKLITDNARAIRKKRDDNKVSLNEAQYKKEQEEINATSKKLDSLQKNSIQLEMANAPADLGRVNVDSSSIAKNKEWLKALGKDIYIAETVNIINDIRKGEMKMSVGREKR